MAAELTIVTFNLRGIHDRWWKRERLVVAGLARLAPDVICLQEAATWCLQARWLAWRLSRATGRRYRVRQARKRGWRGILEGVATLCTYPLDRPEAIALGGEGRVALVTVIRAGGGLAVANAHLEHRSNSRGTRRQQGQTIVRRMEARNEPQVIAGDLNDLPDSVALRALQPGFRTAHVHRADFAGTAPAWEPRGVIDYILVVERVEVVEAATCLDVPVDGTWPSDHIGLWAKLRF